MSLIHKTWATLIIVCCVMQISAAAQSSAGQCGPLLSPLISPSDSNRAYFLPQTLSEFTVKWYSKHLKALKEPVLHSRGDCQIESYRFLWLRTFHPPISIRLWRTGDRRFLVAKKLSGKGGYEPGRLVVNKLRAVTEKEWDAFVAYLDQLTYWTLPTEENNVAADGTVTIIEDGAQWILEGVRDKRYHLVDRQSASGKYRETCLYLIKLSGLKINKTDVY